jgi:hypothetical protein
VSILDTQGFGLENERLASLAKDYRGILHCPSFSENPEYEIVCRLDHEELEKTKLHVITRI